jgi:hypothetical protein
LGYGIHLITVKMAQKDNILQELKELNSTLGVAAQQNVYSAPDGYFDGLIAQVFKRIKAMEAGNAAEEISHLSTTLSGLSRQMPYAVPSNYFEGLTEKTLMLVKSDDQTAKEELESISPLLGGLKKDVPFSVPQGYFENLVQKIVAEENKPAAKVISLTNRKWFRYAAAAMMIGIVAITGFLISNAPKGAEKVMVEVKKDVKKMDEAQKDNLIDFLDAGMTGEETAQVNNPAKREEIKTLLQGISEEELKDFQQQTEDIEDMLTTD